MLRSHQTTRALARRFFASASAKPAFRRRVRLPETRTPSSQTERVEERRRAEGEFAIVQHRMKLADQILLEERIAKEEEEQRTVDPLKALFPMLSEDQEAIQRENTYFERALTAQELAEMRETRERALAAALEREVREAKEREEQMRQMVEEHERQMSSPGYNGSWEDDFTAATTGGAAAASEEAKADADSGVIGFDEETTGLDDLLETATTDDDLLRQQEAELAADIGLWHPEDVQSMLNLSAEYTSHEMHHSLGQTWLDEHHVDTVSALHVPTPADIEAKRKALTALSRTPRHLQPKNMSPAPLDLTRYAEEPPTPKEVEQAWMWHDVYPDADVATQPTGMHPIIADWMERMTEQYPELFPSADQPRSFRGRRGARPLYARLLMEVALSYDNEFKYDEDVGYDQRTRDELPDPRMTTRTAKPLEEHNEDKFLGLADPMMKFLRTEEPEYDEEYDQLNPAVEQAMWIYHRRNPKKWDQRALACEFGMGTADVDAILRAKRIEQQLTDEGILPEWDYFTNLEDHLYLFSPEMLFPPPDPQPARLVQDMDFDRYRQRCEHHWRERNAPLAVPRSDDAPPADGSEADTAQAPRRAPSRWRVLFSDTSTKGEDLAVKVVHPNGQIFHANEEQLIRAVQLENPFWRNRQRSILREPDGYWWLDEARAMAEEAKAAAAAAGAPQASAEGENNEEELLGA